ncbi:unnamed protein product [Trichobilharzia regenti]|nr:unnamed protein product [Trichobilharzia regenti]
MIGGDGLSSIYSVVDFYSNLLIVRSVHSWNTISRPIIMNFWDKNNERVGNLLFITQDPVVTSRVKSQMKSIIRQTWSNPPQHGARIVATILNNPSLFTEW